MQENLDLGSFTPRSGVKIKIGNYIRDGDLMGGDEQRFTPYKYRTKSQFTEDDHLREHSRTMNK